MSPKGSSLPFFERLQQHHAHSHQYVTCRTGKTLVSNTEHLGNLIDTYRLCDSFIFFLYRGCVISCVCQSVYRGRKASSWHQPIGLLITARKWSLGQGNVFTPVCDSVHGGGCIPAYNRADNPPRQDPRILRDTVNKRAVRILLECILVKHV